jgi:2-polyprenyl-3-methyl-5-hydroxy-6-metoxy-1,4-benzoquinol methylase
MSTSHALDQLKGLPANERVYSNKGNAPLIDLLDMNYSRLLDVGCGAGDNAILIKSRNPSCEIYGITRSTPEATIAEEYMKKCWVTDIEIEFPEDIAGQSFDVLVFSHVLEHLRDPAAVLARFSNLLRKGGQVLIAVPNVLSWRVRLQFLGGDFEYRSEGVLDDTHLHFFTYRTADRYLLAKSPDLDLTDKTVTGNVPLWWFRKHVLTAESKARLDRWGCRRWPNLFGNQVLLRAVKR